MKKAPCFFSLATAPHQSDDSLPPGIIQTAPGSLLIIPATIE